VPAVVEMKWKIEVHWALARVWVERIIMVPGGQMPWLSSNTSGCPPEVTRVAPVTHWPVMQGAVGVPVRAQPAMTYGFVRTIVGTPPTVTRGLTAIGVAVPACEQMTEAP
jgi:hypothetical protein